MHYPTQRMFIFFDKDKVVRIDVVTGEKIYEGGLMKRISVIFCLIFLYFVHIPVAHCDSFQEHLNRGIEHARVGEYEVAISEYNKALELNSNNADVYYDLGLAYEALRQYEEAIAYYKKAIEVNPNYAHAYRALGGIYGLTGQFEEAKASFEKAVAIDSNYAEAYIGLGIAYISLGQYQEARESLGKAKEIFQNRGDYQSIQAADRFLKEIP